MRSLPRPLCPRPLCPRGDFQVGMSNALCEEDGDPRGDAAPDAFDGDAAVAEGSDAAKAGSSSRHRRRRRSSSSSSSSSNGVFACGFPSIDEAVTQA